jgi:Protein of unknown function (DUF1449)
MSTHLTDEQLVGLLHGTLGETARAEVKAHVTACAQCAEILAHEAALDEVLWAAAAEAPPPPRPGRAPRRRGEIGAWLWTGAVGLAATAALAFAGREAPMAAAGGGLLAWHNVIFYIPLVIGVLLVLGSAFGSHDQDGDVEHDVHGALDAPGHGDGHGALGKALEVLGVGRVPLTVVLMMASLLFGGLGVIMNTLLSAARVPGWLVPAIAIVAAFAGMLFLTGSAVRVINRAMPATETYRITRHEFAGCTGVLLLPADESSGYAQVKDREGNVHNVKCHTSGDTIAKGTPILIVQYEEESKTYLVTKSPV